MVVCQQSQSIQQVVVMPNSKNNGAGFRYLLYASGCNFRGLYGQSRGHPHRIARNVDEGRQQVQTSLLSIAGRKPGQNHASMTTDASPRQSRAGNQIWLPMQIPAANSKLHT